MASEYNSNLIAKLYQTAKDEELIAILEDMADIGDPVFLHPILAGYEKYKDYSFGHYFLSALRGIKSESIGKYLNDLLEKGEIRNSHIPWFLDVIKEIGYYTPSINKIAGILLKNYSSAKFKESFSLDRWDLEIILEYLKKSGIIDRHREDIRSLLFEENLNREEKAIALNYLLRINTDEEFDYLITNYSDKINKDPELELIVSKELLGWTGKKVEQLKNLIIENGGERTREIIEKDRKEKDQFKIKEEEINQQKKSITYVNLDIVQEIINIRKNINHKTELNEKFLYQLFLEKESLVVQSESVNDEKSFVASCSEFRSIIKEVNEKIKNHGLSKEKVEELSPGINIQDRGKSLHQLYLYFKSRDINVDSDLFGLKLLNKILNLALHPELNKDLQILLSQINALEIYNKKEWAKVHRRLLEFYKECLDKLNKALV